MKVLIIGGTGFISSALVRHLRGAGHHVTLFTRGKSHFAQAVKDGVEMLHGDRSVPSSLEDTVGGRTFDAVYDMVAYRPDESEAAARIFRGRVGRFIHCSTISVYMVSEEVQCPITEEQGKGPLMEFWERNPFGMGYGINKRLCEEVLWKAHDERLLPVSMMRPTFVSGPHDPTRRDFFWIERICDGKPLLIPGSGDCAFQQVYVEDVARMFAALLNHPHSVGKAYNIAAEEIFSLNEYLKTLGRLLQREPEMVHIPQDEFDRLPFSTLRGYDVFPFNTRRTAIFSLDRIKADLHYRSTSFRTWMSDTVRWWTLSHKGHSAGYDRRMEEVAVIQNLRQGSSP